MRTYVKLSQPNPSNIGTSDRERIQQRSGRDRELSGTSQERSRSGPETSEWLAAQEILTNIPAGRAKRCNHS